MAGNYVITNDTNGLFVGFFQILTDVINESAEQGVTMNLSAPGVVSANNNVAVPPLASGAPVQEFVTYPGGGAIVAGTAQPPVPAPTITVSGSGNDTFAITDDTNGYWNGFFLALTAFINAYYANGIIMELYAPMVSPGAPIQNFQTDKYMVNGTAFPAPAEPTITVT